MIGSSLIDAREQETLFFRAVNDYKCRLDQERPLGRSFDSHSSRSDDGLPFFERETCGLRWDEGRHKENLLALTVAKAMRPVDDSAARASSRLTPANWPRA
jgi:hypothetical protein